jgi:hypothetical protein
MSNNTEGNNLKDNNYNETTKAAQNNPKVTGMPVVLGVPSIAGLEFRSKVVLAKCPHCKHNGLTNVEAGWSIKNYLCCYYCGCYWKCLQLIRGKEWTLKDAVHKCSKCNQVIATYYAC